MVLCFLFSVWFKVFSNALVTKYLISCYVFDSVISIYVTAALRRASFLTHPSRSQFLDNDQSLNIQWQQEAFQMEL